MTCHSCGAAFISSTTSCPSCGGFGKAGNEMTKKVLDDSDLKKGW